MTSVLACAEHAPYNIAGKHMDDIKRSCAVCGKKAYNVHEYRVPREGYRSVNYERVNLHGEKGVVEAS